MDDSADEENRAGQHQVLEADLVAAVAAGSAEALGSLYDRYSGMLLGLTTRILGNREDAEEVLQEAMLQAWRQADRYDASRSSVSTWLVLITRSRAIDRLRNRQVVQRTLTAVKQEPASRSRTVRTSSEGPRNVLKLERRRRLSAQLAKLPEEQREVLEKAFYEGMTQREIAASTGTPLGTVKTRSLLAMRKLRTALEDEIEDLL